MSTTSKLQGKKVLIVDDEGDILEVLEELLSMCEITKATTFQQAKKALESQDFDVAVLDIMGVDGYALLDIANKRGITAVMLTAHAFTPANLKRSIEQGAASYIPKDEIGDIAEFLVDVLEAKERSQDPWASWAKRLPMSYFEKRWGAAWQDADKDFWQRFKASLEARRAQRKSKE